MISGAISRRSLMAGLAVGVSGLQACAQVSDLYGFRLNIRLLLPDGLIDVEAVRRVSETRHNDWVPTANRTHRTMHGQAIPVDLGSRTLYVTKAGYETRQEGESDRTLVGGWQPEHLSSAYPDWSVAPDDLVIDLQPLQLPAMVVFDNPAVPQTIRVVMPSDLSQEFPGVRLGRCTVRPSRDRATMSDVRQRLPWLNDDSVKPDLGDHVYADQNMFG